MAGDECHVEWEGVSGEPFKVDTILEKKYCDRMREFKYVAIFDNGSDFLIIIAGKDREETDRFVKILMLNYLLRYISMGGCGDKADSTMYT